MRLISRIIKTFTYALIFFLLLSCRDSKYIIPEDKFVEVLVDIHIADAIALQNTPRYSGFILDSSRLYGAVFAEHGIDQAMFDSTISYYGTHPDEFLEVYDKVSARLKIMLDEVVETPEPSSDGKVTEMVWQDNRLHAFPEMGNERVEINVPVTSLGEYTASATIKLYKDDESVNPRISLYFWYDNNTPEGYRDPFEEVPLEKSDEQLSYAATKVLSDPGVTHIKGYILNYSNKDSSFRQHALVSEISVNLKY